MIYTMCIVIKVKKSLHIYSWWVCKLSLVFEGKIHTMNQRFRFWFDTFISRKLFLFWETVHVGKGEQLKVLTAVFCCNKNWKQPTCGLIVGWVSKCMYIHTMVKLCSCKKNTACVVNEEGPRGVRSVRSGPLASDHRDSNPSSAI